MATKNINLGTVPVSRGEFNSTTIYYKDNIVQYKRGSYQVVSKSPIIGVPPTNDKNVVNPGWTLFAGTLDAQDVVNQVKDQETKSIQAVATREAEILAKSDAAELSFDNIGTSLSGTNVQDALVETDSKVIELDENVSRVKDEMPRNTTAGDAEMQFADEEGNIIAEFKGGHFKVKEFDTRTAPVLVDISNYRDAGAVLPLNAAYVFRSTPVHGISGHFDTTGQNFIAFCIAHEGADETDYTVQVYLKSGNDFRYSGVFDTSNAETPLEQFIAQSLSANLATQSVAGLMSAKDKKTLDGMKDQIGDLEEKTYKSTSEAKDIDNIFSICDKNGNIIAKFNNGFEVTPEGHIIIKGGFSSVKCQEKIDELNEKIDKSVGDCLSETEDVDNIFSICDKRGEIIAKFNSSIRIESALAVEKDGVIKTENFNSSYTTSAARARFPRINFKKSPLRILDIGNSHSLCSEAYLGVILESQGVNIDDIAFCCISRGGASFKSFYQGWHDQDTSGEGDELTGGAYLVSKQFGGLDIKVSGNTYISNGDGTFTFDKKVENHSLTSNMLTCWGGDTSLIRDLMTKNQFDIILIHGHNGYLEYEESNRWRDHSDFGYMTELIRLIKTYQPSATLTYLYPLIYFNYYQKYKTLEQMDECHKIWCRSLRKYMADSGVEYVIPSGTALLNLRHSSCLSAIDSTEIEDSTSGTPIMRPFESASDFAGGVANYETRFGLHYDIPHTAFGIAGYTMSCAIYEFLFAPRFDKSILGNSLREEFKYLYFGGRNHLYLKPMKKDADGNMIPCTVYNTFSAELGWDKGRRPTIRVTDTNAKICQMAAILAVSDIWGINNPDNIII